MNLYISLGDMLLLVRGRGVFTTFDGKAEMDVVSRLGLVFFLAFLTFAGVCVLLSNRSDEQRGEYHMDLNVSAGFIIALDPVTVTGLRNHVQKNWGISDTRVFRAINDTEALKTVGRELPVYVQNLVRWGRHDHMQLYSGGSLGCLLSHIAVWRQVEGVALVLEEDAILDSVSLKRLDQLLIDMKNISWDLLMLEGGHVGLTGVWTYIGQNAATCANWSTSDSSASCNWMGSRGYLITQRGAQLLLKNSYPLMVQTDALMGLTATFDPTFVMYWSVADITHPTYLRSSRLWDGCIKCYAPLRWFWYPVLGLALVLLGALCAFVIIRLCYRRKQEL